MEWYLLALISAFLSAFAAIVEKKTLFKEEALQMTFLLGIFNAFLTIPFFFMADLTSITGPALIAVFIKSLLGALAFLCVMKSIKNLELSEALPLLVLTPGFVAIFAFIFLGEILTIYEILGLVMLMAGTYILELKEKRTIKQAIKKIVGSLKSKYKYIIFALVLFTASSVLSKVILDRYKLAPPLFMGFQHLFLAVLFLAIFLIFNKSKRHLSVTFRESGLLIFILAITTIFYRYSEILAVKSAYSVALVIAIKRISVFFAVVIGGRLFREKDLLRKAIAVVILIIGTLLVINY